MGHTFCVGDVDPVLQKYPALQLPLHDAVAKPVVPPYSPAAHSMHDDAFPTLYVPTPHTLAVAVVEPATHAYPAAHGPLHSALVRLVDDPYRPGAHAPLHADVVSPVPLPYWPAGHSEHTLDPGPLHWPAAHTDAVAVTDPAGQ